MLMTENETESKEMLESVQLNLENKEESNEIEIKKESKKPIKEDKKKTKELYAEFSSFLETTTSIGSNRHC